MIHINEKKTSTEALYGLLSEVIEEPESWIDNDNFIIALKAQGKLAQWEDIERRIMPCTINSLKARADKFLNTGFVGLNQLRIAALDAIEAYKESEKNSNKSTKAGLQLLVKNRLNKIQLLDKQNMVLVYLIADLQQMVYKYASYCDESTIAQCKREMEQVRAKISSSGIPKLISEELQ